MDLLRPDPDSNGFAGSAVPLDGNTDPDAIGQIDLRVVLGLAIGGIPAVLIAAFIVKSMSVELLRWLVIVVVLYASAIMFRAALMGRREEKTGTATSAVAVS